MKNEKTHRNRSKNLRQQNLQLRKRIQYLESIIDWENPPEAAVGPSIPQKPIIVPTCPECSAPVKTLNMGSLQVIICTECGYRKRQ